MKTKLRAALAIFATSAVMMTMTACGGESPTAPDVSSITAPAPTSTPTPAPTPTPSAASCNTRDLVAVPVNFTSGGQLPEVVKVRISNPKSTSCSGIRLTSWNATNLADQVKFADSDGRYPPVEELSVKVPCGVPWVQIDTNNSPYTPVGGRYSPAYFVPPAFYGRGPACSQPSPPPTPPPSACEGVGTPAFSMTLGGTTAPVVTTRLTFAPGFTGSINLSPSPVSGFPGGTVTSGNVNNSNYNPPSQPLVVDSTWQVKKGNEVCRSGQGSVTVNPPQRTCENVNLVLQNPQVSGTSATCTATWNPPPSSSTMLLDNGTPRTVTPGVGTTYSNLSAGNHVCKITVVDGQLSCTSEKPFTINPERTCGNVNPQVSCSVSGDDATCHVSWVNPGSGSIKLNSGSYESIANGANKAYNNLTNGNYTATLKVDDGGLSCTDTDNFTVQQSCEQQHPPTASFLGFTDQGGTLWGRVHLENVGGWVVYMYATSTESKCNAGNFDYQKDREPMTLACGSTADVTVSYPWQGHASEWWWVAWTNSGTPSAGGRSQCIRNTHN